MLKLKPKHLKRPLLVIAIGLLLIVAAFIVPLPLRQKVVTPQVTLSDFVFPKDFLWGSATSSHQVEGDTHNDWTAWEQQNAQRLAGEAQSKFGHLGNWPQIKDQAQDPQNYISGRSADHYTLYPEDITIMKELGLNSYRFSIEWSRIEPEEGVFSQIEMDHYKQVIAALKQNGIEPLVTLWHRTQPLWVGAQGEWENPKTIQDFAQYAEFVATSLGPDVEYYMTFNEPVLHLAAGYIEGSIPPGVTSLQRGTKAYSNMMEAHAQAYTRIHAVDATSQVGSTHAMQRGSGAPNTLANAGVAKYFDYYANYKFLDETKDTTDFIGIQYYAPTQYRLTFGGGRFINVKNFHDPAALVKSDMGWEVYPHGIYEVITKTHKRYGKPIIITENGIADSADLLRGRFIQDHLYWVSRAIAEGVPVKGYMYWSLLDNFEWDKGYWPRFGLVHIDYNNPQKPVRAVRPSAYMYRDIIFHTTAK